MQSRYDECDWLIGVELSDRQVSYHLDTKLPNHLELEVDDIFMTRISEDNKRKVQDQVVLFHIMSQ